MRKLALVLGLFLCCAVGRAQYIQPKVVGGSGGGGGTGTVTSVTSANARATVANTTTTPVITIVSAPIADSVTNQASLLAGKQNTGTYLGPSDTTGLHNQLGLKLNITDTASFANQFGLKAPKASPTFTGTVTTPLGAGTVRSSSGGVLSATASDTVGLGASLFAKAPTASPSFTGTVTTPLGAGTVRSSSGGVLSSTASDTVGLASALAGKQASGAYILTYTDSIRVGPAQFPSPTAADTLPIYVWASGMSVAQIQVQIKGGTSDSVNVLRSRSGTVVRTKATSVFASSVTGYPGTWTTGNADQNQTLNIGDLLLVVINAPSGSPANIAVQILLTKTR